MITNPYQGVVSLRIDGQELPMRLTLGALAELEDQLDESSLMGLIERFESGAFKARDIICLITAGLRGAGWQGRATDLVNAEIEGGPVHAAKLAAQLLARAFAVEE